MLVDERIALNTIRQYATKEGIKVSKNEIDLEVKRIRGQYKSGAAFRKTLEREGITDDLLRDILREVSQYAPEDKVIEEDHMAQLIMPLTLQQSMLCQLELTK